jgi:Family of unknown function (DUF6289)
MFKRMLLAAVLFLGVLFTAIPAMASYRHSREFPGEPVQYEIDYYSDSTHNVIVGWYILHCDCSIDAGGTVTSYYEEFNDACPPGTGCN